MSRKQAKKKLITSSLILAGCLAAMMVIGELNAK
tara:strand:- start:341 stop:442 length:102 start_codon:yes stop_codon:yes gene_type:complete